MIRPINLFDVQGPRKPGEPAFGYKSILKTQFVKGNLPTVKYGIYGGRLTNQNVSLEHLKPHSKGGKNILSNFALATKENNSLRGNDDIKNYLDIRNVTRYLTQFIDVKTEGFDGNKYIDDVVNTIINLLTKGKRNGKK